MRLFSLGILAGVAAVFSITKQRGRSREAIAKLPIRLFSNNSAQQRAGAKSYLSYEGAVPLPEQPAPFATVRDITITIRRINVHRIIAMIDPPDAIDNNPSMYRRTRLDMDFNKYFANAPAGAVISINIVLADIKERMHFAEANKAIMGTNSASKEMLWMTRESQHYPAPDRRSVIFYCKKDDTTKEAASFNINIYVDDDESPAGFHMPITLDPKIKNTGYVES